MGYLLVKILKMGLILGLGRYFVYDDLMEYKEFTKHSCAMTSMWRVPQLLPLFEDVSTNYKVSLYGEGEYLKKSYEADYLDGIPVIYIPGNKASAQQARSLGSLLQNKTETRKSTFHFNVFAVDFNEEINIFSSSILRREATFLIDIMFKLDSLYDPLINPNKKYIIVSHSMGGIVARMAARSCEKFKSKLSMIVSLGTPHKHSPMMITKDIVNEWKYMQQLKDVPVISIGGGLLDFQIEETLIKEGHIMAYNLQTVDRAWTMADHQCLVWCNQLQRAISRLLFDYASLDPSKTSNSVIHKLAQKNFNSSTLSYPSLALPDSSLVGLDKDLLSNSAFIFSIRKTNTKHGAIYHINKKLERAFSKKEFFFDNTMAYTYAIEDTSTGVTLLHRKNASDVTYVEKNKLTSLSVTGSSVIEIKLNVSSAIEVFKIKYISPVVIYRINIVSSNVKNVPKMIFKSKCQTLYSNGDRFIFSFFDYTEDQEANLFVISNPESTQVNDEQLILHIHIDICLTLLRVLKMNLTHLPLLFSLYSLMSSCFATSFKPTPGIYFALYIYIITRCLISSTFLAGFIIIFVEMSVNLECGIYWIVGPFFETSRLYLFVAKWKSYITSSYFVLGISLISLFVKPLNIVNTLFCVMVCPNCCVGALVILFNLPNHTNYFQNPYFLISLPDDLFGMSAILPILLPWLIRCFKSTFTFKQSSLLYLVPFLFPIVDGTSFEIWENVAFIFSISIAFLNVSFPLPSSTILSKVKVD